MTAKVYALGDVKVCPTCGKEWGIELYIFRNSDEVAAACLHCRRSIFSVREEGALVNRQTCDVCGHEQAAGRFLVYPPGLAEARAAGQSYGGLPERVPCCVTCWHRMKDPAAAEARRQRRAETARRRRVRDKAGKGPARKGRPETITAARVLRVLEAAGHGLTADELREAWARELGAEVIAEEGVPAAVSFRKALGRHVAAGLLARALADPYRGPAGGYSYRPAAGVTGAGVARTAEAARLARAEAAEGPAGPSKAAFVAAMRRAGGPVEVWDLAGPLGFDNTGEAASVMLKWLEELGATRGEEGWTLPPVPEVPPPAA